MSHSKYAARMRRLSSKIFGEYRYPPTPVEILRENHNDSIPRIKWMMTQKMNMRCIKRHKKLQRDIDPFFVKYYPPHPQIRSLVHVLRQYGLFRDEHMDFKEEMKRVAALRGKTGRVLGGMSGKRQQIAEKDTK